jgi:phenylalanyl-tRNA synthetase beta chain
MLLPINWLSNYVTITEPIEAVAERFIGLGFECEVVNNNIIDLEITPNRGDVLSVIGLAREYAAVTSQTVQLPQTRELTFAPQLPDFSITADPTAYHRLTAIIVKNVTVGPSPEWLKKAIESMGGGSINNIVDLTNYVMFELGVPLHAFDLDALPTQSFNVRPAVAGETFVSLKDEQCKLPEGAIVVESNGEIVDLLGIRGGKSSMVQPTTKNLLLWAVNVPRPAIRKTSKALGLRTDASYRFEREVDIALSPTSLARMVDLTLELAGGEISTATDFQATTHPTKTIPLSVEAVNTILGLTLSEQQVINYLTPLGFSVDGHYVTVPSWRYHDINITEDLVEEVARMYGYNALPRTIISPIEKPAHTNYASTENLKDQLITAGLTEVYTESFAGREETKLSGIAEDNLAVLANPVNQDFAYCRPAITPNLLKLLSLNAWSDDAQVFEIGRVFPSKDTELDHLAIAAYGKKQKQFEQWVPAEAIQLITPEHPLGKHFKLRKPVTVAEVPVTKAALSVVPTFIAPAKKPKYKPVSLFPPSVRDISMIVSTEIDISQLLQTIQDISPERILLVELFDQFQSERFGPNRQSLGVHVIYQSINNTLATEEVDALHQQVAVMLINQFQAEIR